VSRTGGIGDGHASGKSRPSAKDEQSLAELVLAAMEVLAPGEVDPQAIGGRHRCDRRPSPNCEKRQPIEQRRVGLRLGGTKVQVRHKRTRVRGSHADMDSERLRASARRDDLFSSPNLPEESQRGSDRLRDRCGLLRFRRWRRFEWMLGGLRSTAQLAGRRLRMPWQGRDLCLNIRAREHSAAGPPGARPPAAPARDRASAGIVVDG
jgi:hypothetical protein